MEKTSPVGTLRKKDTGLTVDGYSLTVSFTEPDQARFLEIRF